MTTLQEIIDRAVALSVANQGLADNAPDLIYRINQYQRKRWTQFAQVNRTLYQTRATITSSAANGGRIVDLTQLSQKVERLLIVKLANGTQVHEVDLQDEDAELAPRYFLSGESLVEVGTDWDIASSDAVNVTLAYIWRPNDLDPAGGTSQLVSIPDGYVGMLVDELGAYLASQDVGRPDTEVARLMDQSDKAAGAWIGYAGHLSGISAYRYNFPVPSPQDKS